MGSLLIGATVASCKQQATSGEVKTNEPKKDTVTDLSNCYVTNVVADTTKKAASFYKIPVKFTSR